MRKSKLALRSRQSTCKLRPGELRRCPLDPSRPLVGFHVACPECGFVNIALALGATDFRVEEETLTFSRAVQCMRCRSALRLTCGLFTWEAPDVPRAS